MPAPKARKSRPAILALPSDFYRMVVEGVPQMIWTATPEGRVNFVNGRFVEYVGRPVEALAGADWREFVHPQDRPYASSRWARALKTGRPFECQYRFRRADGVYRWHLATAQPVKDDAGRIARWIGTCADIEEQMQAAQVMARRAGGPATSDATVGDGEAEGRAVVRGRKFREFLESVPGVAWIKDSRFRYVWISTSYARILGRSLGEMQGRDDFELWPEAIARQYRRSDEQVLRANGPVQSIENSRYSDGAASRWLTVKFPFADAGGAAGVAGLGFDVTGQSGGAPGDAGPVDRLSGRERQVLQMIVDGMTSAEVGLRLGLSSKSVDTYRSRLMAKLGIEDLPGLVKFALRHGLTNER
jgi:PAS domain S-box-containing protein